ncbi:acyl-CoA dehydrogenase [Pseudoalteromonas shioyasakiensis]|uniref:acyl-CoA dehydrogenase n=1 Tax=Pseudoalteromonas TaxID=53246 RepID=UPI000C8E3227|nr:MULTISPECIES: acyl-CoA dehydrogenase [Pseudoalteromonas]MAD04734.1 acyl-CoA dehydrogenase [Pseudoalteromonas sp.]MCG9709375.1 acyl-CoA dehydrogenase [Pseudoalteromonas sp. Isolate3]MCQ8882618.1 acyl-CoA dehydrogenase [Pseudoalteromonas shioyasakiensis]QLE09690.1 acyl-CoA dehydrogenase [Pseudoalteromonas shioyasakiensis]QWV06224.1 acyl-CoA dehydrogenase [Pseudoalteromonas shioyasakiensis]|tara:strand:+ start:14297 stop:16576 length:2280 start_codon:yes stop_codon:yes gene_type:complete
MTTVIILLLVAVIVIFAVKDIRINLVTRPTFSMFKKVLPPLSQTEREAMEAGDVWWDGELFSGNPDWQKLHRFPKPELSEKERAFMSEQVETLLAMLDDYQIVQKDKDLPKEVWDYLKKEGFFALIIPEKFGGREFSAIANSTIVSKIATKSLTAAVTVMVPNSLGPGELLLHYGTTEQQERWLPSLAKGDDVPCFALTGPEAGSDAGSIPDTGVVCKGMHNGEEVIGLKLNWSKRYITLAPIATVLGLAFKMYDPDGLLGDKTELGITCALIPTDHEGVQTGERHYPLNMAFMNGTTYGKDVFIPLDWIIGGEKGAGRGWRMLVECLSAGRGISLPALSTATGHLASRMTSAYATVRQQFGVSIGQFEGVQEALARIGGLTYTLESARLMTAGAIDMKLSPSVVTAIAKYHMTEMGRTVMNDAMDIHSGKGIQVGPNNYLAHGYMGIPVSITVEGANILTRNLMIFGQGATRCHPFVLKEMEAAAMEDHDVALKEFDSLLLQHILFAGSNAGMAFVHGLTRSYFAKAPVSGATAVYYKQLSRMSRGLAFCTDVAMLVLGGELKRKEMISARLGDVLSHLYLASCVLKRYEDEGRQQADLSFVQYAVEHSLFCIGQAFDGFFKNFSNPVINFLLKRIVFPVGNHYHRPSDELAQTMCEHMSKPGVFRDRLTHLCYVDENAGTGVMENAFLAMIDTHDDFKQLRKWQKEGTIAKNLELEDAIVVAAEKNLINETVAERMNKANELRKKAIAVDNFAPGEL